MRWVQMHTAKTLSSTLFAGAASVVAALLDQDCRLCTAHSGSALLCRDCMAMLQPAKGACPQCAMPSMRNELCGQCLRTPPAFDATLAAMRYAHPADILIRQLKFGAQLPIAKLLADRLLDSVRHRLDTVDLVIPMPLHPSRLTERGFNQAMELLRPLRAMLPGRILPEGARRTRATPAQASLPADQRRSNLKGVFSCDLRLEGRRIAVVDDVMTTGASLDELAKVLKRAGATHIENWVVARTWPD
jgi:ComF family protein